MFNGIPPRYPVRGTSSHADPLTSAPKLSHPLKIPHSAHSSVQLPIHLQSLPAVAPGVGAAAWATQNPSLSPAWASEPLLLWMCVLRGLWVLWWPWGLLLTLTRPQEALRKGIGRWKDKGPTAAWFYPLLSYLSFLGPHQLNKQGKFASQKPSMLCLGFCILLASC